MVQAQTKLELCLSFASILFLLFLRVAGWVGCGAYVVGWLRSLCGGRVGVEIEVNANSAPN